MKWCLYCFVTVTVVAAVTEVVVGALIVVVGVVGVVGVVCVVCVVCVVTIVAVDGGGGVDGDIEVAVVDNDEASLGQSETHIHHMYQWYIVPCYSFMYQSFLLCAILCE